MAHPQNLNDRGMVVLAFTFTDGTSGIYRLSPLLADADRDGDLDLRRLGAFSKLPGRTRRHA